MAESDGYGRGARVLSIGIASTGLFTFLYFAVASHVLPGAEYGAVSLLWSVLFVVISVIYRPVEQLLSRTIARRRAVGLGGHPVRVPLAIQAGFATVFLATALALRGPLEELFGSDALYVVFVGATVAYAASYFARGYLAGHAWFALYGGLVLFESVSRFLFPVAVAAGVASGQTAVALGILAAPVASLLVVPAALARHHGRAEEPPGAASERALTMRSGASFAVAVAGVQLAEQTLLNAAVLTARGTAGATVAGIVFNALLITRAPLQLFQAVQTSLLPHLSGLEVTEGHGGFSSAIRRTVAVIAAFAGVVALALLLVGPWAMDLLFGSEHDYGRVGLAVIAVGMGFHLAAGTLNQAALARGRARAAAAAWLACAAAFVAWMLLPVVADELTRAETGYAGAAAVLCMLLWLLERRGSAVPASAYS
ncbi:MAG TPA: hypothetical protein VLA98_00475 [Solirubrobacteraceae bacterium]|nr:hypothetical protein [Solirubrobacteraceae bacterium]HSD80116.1 hypothetical protein [Solirubrobacteraceae bacterium]